AGLPHSFDSPPMGPRKRVARGHKQKGKGTISVDKGPTERDGIEVQSWQRMPMEMLSQYAAKQKRPKPQYSQERTHNPKKSKEDDEDTDSGPRFTFRVVLPDPKNSAKDLCYIPTQSFDTIVAAKEHAALLALMSLQSTLPLERKLPEPYRTTWLESHVAAKAAEKSTSQPGRSKGKKGKATQAAESPAPAPTTAPAATSAYAAVAATAGEGKEGEEQEEPAPPARILRPVVLTSERSFASAYEERKASVEAQQIELKARRHKEKEERAADDEQVLMSAAMREVLLASLGLEQSEGLCPGSDALSLADLDLSERDATACAKVKEMGFQEGHAIAALVALEEGGRVTTTDPPDAQGLTDTLLEWLCLHLAEEALPVGFDPRGRNLDVTVGIGVQDCAWEDGLSGWESIPWRSASLYFLNWEGKDSALVQRLMAYGFRDDECQAAYMKCGSSGSGGDDSAVLAALGLLMPAFGREMAVAGLLPPGGAFGAAGAVGDGAEASEEVVSLLEGAGADMTMTEIGGAGRMLRVDLAEAFQGQPVELDLWIPQSSWDEPAGPPLYPLMRGALQQEAGTLLSAQQELLRHQGGLVAGDNILLCTLIFALYELPTLPLSVCALPPLLKPAKPSTSNTTNATTPAAKAPSRQTATLSKRRMAKIPRGHRDRALAPTCPSAIPAEERRLMRPAIEARAGYKKMARQRALLPAAGAKQRFLGLIKENQVVLVSGETGCGKTTQIPQFLLETWEAGEGPDNLNVIVTQPRRIAAVGVAARVADERCETLGHGNGAVGYKIRGENKTGRSTRLTFCTTGVLLRLMQSDPALSHLTHLVIDEVHERHIEGDFILALMKNVLPQRPYMKLVLMSATIDADKFAAYYSKLPSHNGKPSPVLSIPGRTFPVKEVYLEEALRRTGYRPKLRSKGELQQPPPQQQSGYNMYGQQTRAEQEFITDSGGFRYNVEQVDDSAIDYSLVRSVVMYAITQGADLGVEDGGVLVFLPGAPEINRMCMELGGGGLSRDGGLVEDGDVKLVVLPLHGSLTSDMQQRVFKSPPRGARKVVIATNIAETSITIPDITVVVDTCHVKEMQYDNTRKMCRLVDTWACQAAQTQRKGRAGRVREGVAFKLLKRSTHSELPAHGTPEMLRAPLEHLVLSIKSFGLGSSPAEVLAEALDPPLSKSVEDAVNLLTSLKALDAKGELTALGTHLSRLPCTVSVGKMVVYGVILGCLDPILAIAAGLSCRSPFLSSADREKRKAIDQAKVKLSLAAGGRSDHALVAVA
ncbi:unnamed protein product, partial [Chrysoparadoxa australica]